MADQIEHVIVLMLENRSFDHMLGFLPKTGGYSFEGLSGEESNPSSYPGRPIVKVSKDAHYALASGPDHSHGAVVEQMTGCPSELGDLSDDDSLNMQGFVWNFEKRSLQDQQPAFHGELIMRCFDPDNVPVLATLAREFAICDHWFASVPGETWPNRNYAHAATSHGKVDIELRPYWDKTIFQQLSDAGKKWRVYHDGPTHAWAFPKLWDVPLLRNNFRDVDDLFSHIENNKLPAYSFVEPNHGLLLRNTLEKSNSQHPGSNKETGRDFHAGEKLIAAIYGALRKKYETFCKTLFVITYDEHGGFYDHVPPPKAVAPDKHRGPGPDRFDFKRLGVRVPTVLVSPRIQRRTVDSRVYDHSSIPATVRKLFAPNEGHLTERDKVAKTFDKVLTNTVRTKARLPEVKPLTAPRALRIMKPPTPPTLESIAQPLELGAHERNMIGLANEIERALDDEVMLSGAPDKHAFTPLRWWERDDLRVEELSKDPEKLTAYLKHVTRNFRNSAPQEEEDAA